MHPIRYSQGQVVMTFTKFKFSILEFSQEDTATSCFSALVPNLLMLYVYQNAFNNFLLAFCEGDKLVSDYTVKIDCSKITAVE